jgi:oxygen-independent coproporphyrinogen-3 oxidase
MRRSVPAAPGDLFDRRQAAHAGRPAQWQTMNTAILTDGPIVSADLLRRLDQPGPRYTSYPTADRFIEAFGPEDYERALRSRMQGAARNAGVAPLSLYVHIPFCESLCYYCACNKIVTRHHERAAPYLKALEAEVGLHAVELGLRQPVSQLHLGGGSPTFLSDAELAALMAMLRRAFAISASAEISIEVDPRTADPQRLRHLASLGFNRLSFGVQDFDAAVQTAVHRVQSVDSVRHLLDAARALNFRSTNVDLIYGLPRQTPASFARTIDQVCELRPDRIALYAYAHLPQRFKAQRRIDTALLPPAPDKIAMLAQAIEGFGAAGYAYIGMDHFALPDDPLAIAKRQGRLHRNFQGYSTQPDCDLIGLGVSAIGRIGATYSQNAKTLDEYQDALAQHTFPIARGLALTRDDLLRRAVIMALMCQGRVEFESISLSHLVDFRRTFAAELAALRPLQAEGLVTIDADAIDVTPLGWYFVRSIAMVFDRHLQADRARDHYSRVI